MKKLLIAITTIFIAIVLVACGKDNSKNVKEVISQAQNMTLDELVEKAYQESNGKTVNGIGNSSRGKPAGEAFVKYIKTKHADYTGQIGWQQPKENSIFQSLTSDTKGNSKFAVTLIQDGNQINSKMVKTGILLNFIPKDWKNAAGVDIEENGTPLALQTLSKVFMYNSVDPTYKFNNVWQFVRQGERTLFMGLESEPVGKNFLVMLTKESYAKVLKEAFDALTEAEKQYFQPIIDGLAAKATELKLGENGKYALAWIQQYVKQLQVETDDSPISNILVKKANVKKQGLLVYSKLRSIKETEETSVNNIKVAAYENGYVGFGGYAYKHYLQIPKNSPYPWTAAAFITYMVTQKDGFNPWGKDMGGYSSNPNINQDHSKDGYVEGVNKFPAKNDRGAQWWLTNEPGKGRLVIEDPVYASEHAFTVGDWIALIK